LIRLRLWHRFCERLHAYRQRVELYRDRKVAAVEAKYNRVKVRACCV
jgi:hypothetical protein